MTKTRYQNLFSEIKKLKPRTILEVGTWNGVHGIDMLNLARRYRPNAYYYGYDLFEDFKQADDEYCPKKPAKLKDVQKLFDPYRSRLIKGNTQETLYKYPPDKLIDFVWLDGGHSISTINSDWNGIREHLSPIAVVLLDDYYHDLELSKKYGCRTLVNELQESSLWEVTILEPKDPCNGGTNIAKVTRKI